MNPYLIAYLCGIPIGFMATYRFAFRVRMNSYPSLAWNPTDRYFCTAISAIFALFWPLTLSIAGILVSLTVLLRPVYRLLERPQ